MDCEQGREVRAGVTAERAVRPQPEWSASAASQGPAGKRSLSEDTEKIILDSSGGS